MLHLFIKGGPIMWPLLVTSLVALTVVLERVFFIVGEHFRRDSAVVENEASRLGVTVGVLDEVRKAGISKVAFETKPAPR